MLEEYVVKYVIEEEGDENQYFICMAEDVGHAEEQFFDAYPTANIKHIFIN